MPRNITLFMTLLFATVALMLVGARPRGSVVGTGNPRRHRDLAGDLESSARQRPNYATAGARGYQSYR
jgi:hypothetical protein